MKRNRNSASSLIEKFVAGTDNTPAAEEQRPAEPQAPADGSPASMCYDLTDEEAEQLKVSPELRQALQRIRYEKAGRPRGKVRIPQEDKLQYGYTRATFIVRKETVQKLKYISLMETRTLKDLLGELLGGFVADWESKNGEITVKK